MYYKKAYLFFFLLQNVQKLQTCVLVFVSQQRAALLKGFFTNVTSVKPLVCLLQSLPPWPSISI